MKLTKDVMLPIPNVMNPEVMKVDPEPFMSRQNTDEEVADYDDGFKAGFRGRSNDQAKSSAWQRGWAEAQE